MGDEDARSEFIASNSPLLIKSTNIGTELVTRLWSEGLTNDEETALLAAGTPNITRAALLYTRIANKWSRNQFEVFKPVLKETGNLRAYQVFTNDGADVFLTNDQVVLLKELRNKSVNGGCYEGLSYEDEDRAKIIVECTRNELMFKDGKFKLWEGFDRKDIIPRVKCFLETLKNGVIWWNPRKSPLPEKYVERKIARNYDGKYTETTLIQLVNVNCDNDDGSNESLPCYSEHDVCYEGIVVLIVDQPGMGKSSEIGDLENKLRAMVKSNRVIVRVKLNEVQKALSTILGTESTSTNSSKSESECLSVSSILFKLAPFLPVNILQAVGVRLFVLLDGLDEVCPEYQDTMIKLLRIFNSNEKQTIFSHISVVLTSRPHLRKVVEEEFNLKSWSLLPLKVEEQDEYIKKVLGMSSEQLSDIRGNLTDSVSDLLGNPLMLSMFLNVIKFGDSFSGGALNTFDVYARFVGSKYKLHLVEKEGVREEDNYTKLRLELQLQRNLPHYYRVALIQLINNDKDRERTLKECTGTVTVAQDEPSGVTKEELISVGLLIEDSNNQLVFKHLSLAEFFLARLLTQEKSLPQGARDIIFGFIYAGNVLGNVEAFVVGASILSMASMSKRSTGSVGGASGAAPTDPTQSLLLHLSPKWLLVRKDFQERCETLRKFVRSSGGIPLLVREVLMSFVHGDPIDQWEVLLVLLEDFANLVEWMSKTENRDWTSREFLKINLVMTTPTASYTLAAEARLIVGIGLRYKKQDLLSEEEVGVAMNYCDHRLVSIVAQFLMGSKKSKWGWVEGRMLRGRSHLRELFMQIDDKDLSVIFEDQETTFKLFSILSHEQIFSLVTNQETRVTDVIGKYPMEVIAVLGEVFVPTKQLAEFRWKFVEKNKGKTVFEVEDGCDFAVKYLWDDLLGEVDRRDPNGSVTVALREALGRMEADESWKFLQTLEKEGGGRVNKRVGNTCRRQQNRNHSVNKWKEIHEDPLHVGRVMDWITTGLQLSDTLSLRSLEGLPFIFRYFGYVDQTSLTNLLQQNKEELTYTFELMAVLQSLLILSSFRFLDDGDHIRLFSLLQDFLRTNFGIIPQELRSLVKIFITATRKQVVEATPSFHLVRDICVGEVFLELITQQPTPHLKKETWELIIRDVALLVPCCRLPTVLHRLKEQINESKIAMLKEVLTSTDVLWEWKWRFSSKFRRQGEGHVVTCGVRNFLSFYFSVFDLNLDWMKLRDGVEVGASGWMLVWSLPVEIADALRGNLQWAHIHCTFRRMLREHLRMKGVNNVTWVAGTFSYETEAEWEALLNLINGKSLLRGMPWNRYVTSPSVAAPFFRALLKLYGAEWTSTRLTKQLWKVIASNVSSNDTSIGSFGSLLHTAIQMGDLDEVKRRSWPGVFSWRNEEGKTALQFAKDTYDESHRLRRHLSQFT